MKLQETLTRDQVAYVDLLASAARRIEDEAPPDLAARAELHAEWLRERAREVAQEFAEANRQTGWVERGFWRVYSNARLTSPFVEVVADSSAEAHEVARGAGKKTHYASRVGTCLVRSDERPRKE